MHGVIEDNFEKKIEWNFVPSNAAMQYLLLLVAISRRRRWEHGGLDRFLPKATTVDEIEQVPSLNEDYPNFDLVRLDGPHVVLDNTFNNYNIALEEGGPQPQLYVEGL